MSFIAQFSKFCAKVMLFLHIRKKNVQFFIGKVKKTIIPTNGKEKVVHKKK